MRDCGSCRPGFSNCRRQISYHFGDERLANSQSWVAAMGGDEVEVGQRIGDEVEYEADDEALKP